MSVVVVVMMFGRVYVSGGGEILNVTGEDTDMALSEKSSFG